MPNPRYSYYNGMILTYILMNSRIIIFRYWIKNMRGDNKDDIFASWTAH